MKYSKHYVLSIISWIHSVLLFSVIYPFVGSIMKLTGENWIKFSLISVLLFIPVIISWILVRAIKWFLVYILISVLLGISCGYLGYVYGDIFSISNYVGGVLTAILSLIISFIHGGAKLSYCELKQDYIARHGSTKDFALEPWETTNILTEPSHIHWIWFILLYVIGILINYTVFLKFLFWIVLIDVFLCFFYKYLNGFHQFIREKRTTRISQSLQ